MEGVHRCIEYKYQSQPPTHVPCTLLQKHHNQFRNSCRNLLLWTSKTTKVDWLDRRLHHVTPSLGKGFHCVGSCPSPQDEVKTSKTPTYKNKDRSDMFSVIFLGLSVFLFPIKKKRKRNMHIYLKFN